MEVGWWIDGCGKGEWVDVVMVDFVDMVRVNWWMWITQNLFTWCRLFTNLFLPELL